MLLILLHTLQGFWSGEDKKRTRKTSDKEEKEDNKYKEDKKGDKEDEKDKKGEVMRITRRTSDPSQRSQCPLKTCSGVFTKHKSIIRWSSAEMTKKIEVGKKSER